MSAGGVFLILVAGATYCDGKSAGRAYLPLAKEAVEQDSEPSSPLKDRPVQPTRHRNLGQLKRDVSGAMNHLRPDLDQLVPRRWQVSMATSS